LPNWSRSSAKNSADFGSACTGLKGSSKPRSLAVPGMNCAIPCARRPLRVTGPTASERKRLSCQITRAKNSSGRSEALAADSIIRHIASRASLSRAPSAGFGAGISGCLGLD
jgi:hypothetical protein